MIHEPPLFAAWNGRERLAKGLLASAAHAVRYDEVREGFCGHVHQSLGEVYNALSEESQSRMCANAEVFFDFEIPAVAGYGREFGRATDTLTPTDLTFAVMADPRNRDKRPYGFNIGPQEAQGSWTVQPGSGTAQLTGLRGSRFIPRGRRSDGHWQAQDELV